MRSLSLWLGRPALTASLAGSTPTLANGAITAIPTGSRIIGAPPPKARRRARPAAS